MRMSFRLETDSLGSLEVPCSCYYGAQTARAIQHFHIGEERMPWEIIRALALIKKVAALTHRDLGVLSAAQADWIVRAAEEVMDGTLEAHFPLMVWQTGSGTQTHMNVNEVIANRANELAGSQLGAHTPIHPNDDVNHGQSTNDVFPTAMHIAVVEQLTQRLVPRVTELGETLTHQAEAFGDIVKIGRTHLMDATPLTLGQEFSGYATQVHQGRIRVERCLPALYELALGGTAVGTGLNAHPDFAVNAIAKIAELTGLPFCPVANTFAALAAHDAIVALSGALKTLAGALMKIANDIRWLASGPRAGLGELTLPANEPGSSMMPGKVNPTQAEAITMIAVQVMGNDAAISMAGALGNFELNVYKPVIAYNILQSVRLLADGCHAFNQYCVSGIAPNRARMETDLQQSLMLVTALVPHIGYDKAAQIAQKAHADNLTLREAAEALGCLRAEDVDRLIRPEAMLAPTQSARTSDSKPS
jgi:fumarate hydratase class II